jgi:WD40 repeat protein
MSSKMLYEAIALIRASKLDEARKMIFEIIRNEPTNEMAWMWLAETLSSDSDRMKVLLACQMENPNSRITKIAIEKLQEKIDLDAEQAPSVAPFKQGATFDPSLPERTGHTGAIIGFDGSFIVSEVSDFDEVIDLRKNEEEIAPFKEEGETEVIPESSQVFVEDKIEEGPVGFVFDEQMEEIQPAELEFEPDLSTLFQDENIDLPGEKAFEFDEEFDFGLEKSEGEDQSFDFFSDSDVSGLEDTSDALTAFDLGFTEDSSTLINEPDVSEEDTDRIRTLMQEDELVEDVVIKSGVEEFERRRKKKDRNMVILVSGLFILIAVLCLAAVYVIFNYSKFTGRVPSITATQMVVVQPEVSATATLAPTATATPQPTATATTIPTATPLVALSDKAINPENVGGLQIKLQREFQDAVATSLDGNRVAYADGKTVTVFNSADGSQLFELSGHTSNVTDMVFSVDGNYLVSAADDFTVYLWNLKIGTLDKSFVFDGNTVNRVYAGNNFPRDISVDYSPDGSTIAAGAFGLISIFDIPSGLSRGYYEINVDELKAIFAESNSPQGFEVKFSENGWILAAGMSGSLVGVDTLDATPLYQFELGSNADILFADDRLVMLEADTGGVSLRRLDTGEIYNGFGGVDDKPDLAAPDYGLSGNWEVIGIETDAEQNDVQLTIWNILQDQKVVDFPAVCEDGNCRLPIFEISPVGDWVAVEQMIDSQIIVQLFDLQSQTEMLQLDKFSSAVQSISISPRSELIAVLDQNGILRVWDVKFGAQRVSLNATDLEMVEFSKNGRYLFGWNFEKFIVWSLP